MFIKILNKVLIFVIFIIIAFDMIYITYITIKLGNGNHCESGAQNCILCYNWNHTYLIKILECTLSQFRGLSRGW